MDQQLSAIELTSRRSLSEEFRLDLMYTVSSDKVDVKDQIVSTVSTDDFQTEAASVLKMSARIERDGADTVSPSSSPSEIPSKPPSPKPTHDVVDGYEYVGPGHCLDDSNRRYDNFVERTADNLAGCGAGCDPLGNVRGFWMQDTTCQCLMDARIDDGTEPPTPLPTGLPPGPTPIPTNARIGSEQPIPVPTKRPTGLPSLATKSSKSPKGGKKRAKAKKKRKRKHKDKPTPTRDPARVAALLGDVGRPAQPLYLHASSKSDKSGKNRRALDGEPAGGSGPIATSDYVDGQCYRRVSQHVSCGAVWYDNAQLADFVFRCHCRCPRSGRTKVRQRESGNVYTCLQLTWFNNSRYHLYLSTLQK